MGQIIILQELPEYLKKIKNKNIVLVGGCFDLLHYGHLTFLQNAKQKGDILVVALESDEFIERKKTREPIHTQRQRAEILSSLQIVDLVILLPLFKENSEYFDLVKQVHPAVIAVTENDHHIDKKREQANAVGAKVIIVTSILPKFSSSRILLNDE